MTFYVLLLSSPRSPVGHAFQCSTILVRLGRVVVQFTRSVAIKLKFDRRVKPIIIISICRALGSPESSGYVSPWGGEHKNALKKGNKNDNNVWPFSDYLVAVLIQDLQWFVFSCSLKARL